MINCQRRACRSSAIARLHFQVHNSYFLLVKGGDSCEEGPLVPQWLYVACSSANLWLIPETVGMITLHTASCTLNNDGVQCQNLSIMSQERKLQCDNSVCLPQKLHKLHTTQIRRFCIDRVKLTRFWAYTGFSERDVQRTVIVRPYLTISYTV